MLERSQSPHTVTPLASSDPPKTVKGLRSWMGAFKHLRVCIPHYSPLLSELEAATAGKESRTRISWTKDLLSSFSNAQKALSDLKCITIPRPEDELIITSDGAVKAAGVGAILYSKRNKALLVSGFFSAKLKPHQQRWLPFEVEALAISSAVNHWSPFIIESKHPVQVLTDLQPCVQAFAKLGRGEFSSSGRVSTFLSTLSRCSLSLQHIPGDTNLPVDFHSRTPPTCSKSSCQVCQFVSDAQTSSVLRLSVDDILEGKATTLYAFHITSYVEGITT